MPLSVPIRIMERSSPGWRPLGLRSRRIRDENLDTLTSCHPPSKSRDRRRAALVEGSQDDRPNTPDDDCCQTAPRGSFPIRTDGSALDSIMGCVPCGHRCMEEKRVRCAHPMSTGKRVGHRLTSRALRRGGGFRAPSEASARNEANCVQTLWIIGSYKTLNERGHLLVR